MSFDDAEDMCENCVTPWKCNGPHIPSERPYPDAIAAAYARGQADERARWEAAIAETEHDGHCASCCVSSLAPSAPETAPERPEAV